MTCDVEYRKEALSQQWTEDEVAQMEAEVKLARAKASRAFVQRNPYGTYTGRRKAEDKAEKQAREAAHDRHVLRMFREQALNPKGKEEKIPLDDWMALHGHHIHAGAADE